jgi:NADPH-dependent 2,4-dienoyl-CoA reductase/sulfur reductase-like enzyme/rhodanese-related sulfurtransferase
MANRKIVILGGALAGPTAAARARELDESAEITLVERNSRVSYATCGLAYHLSGEVPGIDALDRQRAEFFDAYYRVDVCTHTEALAIDGAKKTITLRGRDGDSVVAYDALVFALGAESSVPAIAGLEGENVRPLRTVDDLVALRGVLGSGRARVAVLGGGPFGIEAADGLTRGGAVVTVIEREASLLPRFGAQVSAIARDALRTRGAVHTGVTVTSVRRDGARVSGLSLSDGTSLDVDAVVVAAGLRPRTQMLAAAGARLAADGTVIVDERAETSLPGVFGAGVCVSVPQAVSGTPLWWPQGAIADKTAQVAGENAAGGDALLAPALGSTILRCLDVAVGRTGLSRAEAQAALGADAVASTVVHAPSHESYFPGAATLTVELLWRRADGRVVGVEVAGAAGVDKRVDAAAGAIAAGLTVDQLAALDFAYEPPFSPARDPLNVAATVARAERRGLVRSVSARQIPPHAQLVDVRTEGAPSDLGAVAIALPELRQRLGELDRARPVVVVSEDGRLGFLAARVLAQNGFADVANLAGGLRSRALESGS